jgi:Tol biopolymer transport system component
MVSCIGTKRVLNSVSSKPLSTPGQIAFVTLDGNIALSDAAGKNIAQVTTDANTHMSGDLLRIYAFPTFSGDGKSLAFVEYTTISGTDTVTQTLVDGPAQPKAKLLELYTTVDDNIPYLDWSPDSQQIAFLTIHTEQGMLRVVGKAGGTPVTLEQGSSAYWNWRNDSSSLVTHMGGSPATDADAHLSIVGVKSATPARLASAPGNFKAPHYSPDAHYLLYVARTGDNDDLVLADASGKPICSIAPLEIGASFAWSPDGRRVAWIDSASSIANPAPLYVFDLSAGIRTRLHDDAVAFFWSPDSSRLAVYSIVTDNQHATLGAAGGKLDRPAAQAQSSTPVLRIESLNVSTGDTLRIADTFPSNTLISILEYFDQYSRALTPWSPDGQQLVFTSASQTTDSIDLEVATFDRGETGVSLKSIGEGVVAFWAPR